YPAATFHIIPPPEVHVHDDENILYILPGKNTNPSFANISACNPGIGHLLPKICLSHSARSITRNRLYLNFCNPRFAKLQLKSPTSLFPIYIMLLMAVLCCLLLKYFNKNS